MAEGISGGSLDQRFTFQRATATPDGQGGQGLSWTTLASALGRMTPVQGRESDAAARLVATVTHNWIVRFTSAVAGVTPKDRIQITDVVAGIGITTTFEIVSVMNPDSRHRDGLTGTALQLAA